MITFDPKDPFPLLEPGSHSYVEAQAHSRLVDEWLGLETERIEATLVESAPRATGGGGSRQELWIGLPVQALLTPYSEIRNILHTLGLRAGQTVVDLGAGYGRMGFVIGTHAPGSRFIGYEYVRERVVEANRVLEKFSYPGVEMREADLTAIGFRLEPADIYFLYDYGTKDAIAKTIEDLRLIAQNRPIVVVGRGRSSRDLIERESPWLSQVIAPRHFEHFSIYRSAAEA